MAKKKKSADTTKAAKPPAKQKKAPASKSKAAAEKKKSPAKSKAATKKKASPAKSKAVTEKKSSAVSLKAVTNKKTSGTMAKKEIPADSNDKKLTSLKPQAASDEQKKELEKRAANKDGFNQLISEKVKPMLSDFVKRTEKTTDASKTLETKSGVKPATREIAIAPDNFTATEVATSDTPSEVTHVSVIDESPSNEESSDTKSIFGLDFNFRNFESKPFLEALENFLSPAEIAPVESEPPTPMVIVADFTLPYHCCEDYVCEDMCYTDDELSMLPIPPFAKDDFAVTRKDVSVDIYPDMNDTHLFKDYIVVKEIDEEQSFLSTAGGEVKTDKTGEHPRFIYTPPKGESGISDSFIYTLYNIKNELSDTATVWIEVAKSIPTFSMSPLTVCRNAGLQTVNVDPVGNDWDTIEVNGRGIEKIINPNAEAPVWTFNPRGLGVIAGSNRITLTLSGEEVGEINITVTEILADFFAQGELINIDGGTGLATIAVHDLSLNGQDYEWEWFLLPDGPVNVSRDIPDAATRTVLLPLADVSELKENFTISMKIAVRSPEGCIDRKEGTIEIIWPVLEPGTPEIVTTTDEICADASPINIVVDAQRNDWAKIELVGNGVVKTVDATQVPTWTFDPRGTNVVVGINTLRLELDGDEVDRLDITVVESIAGFDLTGEIQFTNPGKPGGFVVVRDRSVNAKGYTWKWTSRYGSGKQDITPDANGNVRIPFPTLPVNPDNFDINMTLVVLSAQGCENGIEGTIKVEPPQQQVKITGVDIVKKYLEEAEVIITTPKDLLKIGITQPVIDEIENDVARTLNQVNNPLLIEDIRSENYDARISSFAENISALIKMAPPEDFVSNVAYMTLLNNLNMAMLGLLTIRQGDLNNAEIVSAEKLMRGTIDNMTSAGYRFNTQTKDDFSALMGEITSTKPQMRESYLMTNDFMNRI